LSKTSIAEPRSRLGSNKKGTTAVVIPLCSPYNCLCPSIVHSHDRNGLGQLVSITERSFLKQERRQCLWFGTKGSEVQIFSSQLLKKMGYGLGRSPFFVAGNSMGNK
jgi:hypothetical protein